MNGSLRVAGLLLATTVATTALPGVAVAASGATPVPAAPVPAAPDPADAATHTGGQAESDRQPAQLLAGLTRLDLLQRLGILKKMNAKYPGLGAVLDKVQAISVTGLLGQSIPSSPENEPVTNLLNDPSYKGTADGAKAQPKDKTALAVLKESAK